MNTINIPGFDDDKNETLKIGLEKSDEENGALVVNLAGYLDTYNSIGFQKRMTKVIESGYARLIFNCTQLNYVSSTGIGSFTAFLRSVKPLGGNIVLICVQPKVMEVFQLLGFSQFFVLKANLADAVSFFKKAEPGTGEQAFPRVFTCPICSKKLKAPNTGRFRCSECKSILVLGASGEVTIQ
jgi:anti-anti-sigma factor